VSQLIRAIDLIASKNLITEARITFSIRVCCLTLPFYHGLRPNKS
jgi:hypothetical protein